MSQQGEYQLNSLYVIETSRLVKCLSRSILDIITSIMFISYKPTHITIDYEKLRNKQDKSSLCFIIILKRKYTSNDKKTHTSSNSHIDWIK